MCVYVEGSWKLLIPVEKYGDMLYRLSLSMLRNKQDAEDSVQDTFMRYLYKSPNSMMRNTKRHGFFVFASTYAKTN